MRVARKSSEQRPSVEAVARRAGVSTATVSRALNGHPYVAEQVRERVLKAVSQLKYQVNSAARDLARGRSSLVLVAVGDPIDINLSANHLMRRAANEVLLRGEFPVLAGGAEPPPQLAQMLSSVSGALVLPGATSLLPALRAHGVPAVLLDAEPGPGDSAIAIDRREGCAMAARHLLERGHRALAFLDGGRSEKFDGFSRAAREGGASVTKVDVEALPAFLAREKSSARVTAWFLPGENMIVPTLSYLAAAGRVLGRDTAFICLGDTYLAQRADPPITALRHPHEAMARMALDLLRELRLHGVQPERRVTLMPELIVRASTDFILPRKEPRHG